MKLEKEEQIRSKVSKIKEIIKVKIKLKTGNQKRKPMGLGG